MFEMAAAVFPEEISSVCVVIYPSSSACSALLFATYTARAAKCRRASGNRSLFMQKKQIFNDTVRSV